jgi:hypothetical protein
MKNLFKLGFVAFTLSLSLTACDWFSSEKKATPADSVKIDSIKADSIQKATNAIDSIKTKVDSVQQTK